MATSNKTASLTQLRAQLAEVTQKRQATLKVIFAHQDSPPSEDWDTRARESWRLTHVLSYYQMHETHLEYAVQMQAHDPSKTIVYTADGLIGIQVCEADWLTDLARMNGSRPGLIEAYQQTIDMSDQMFQLTLRFILPDGEVVLPTDFEPLTLPEGVEPLSFA